ncbi:MAG: aminotransferase class I/II-fold pyridoxal phosphate-dependent enzyme [Candidatus Methanoperedens sp.]|jgi:aminotransferase|nr:aminotransferase class I/II-fold pyridoxal phosphate-dependent enzyme [Candidatus Methanoperedens sp.]PKL54371.1 MAG: aromatic amino acid aminotransferase [Candidatus Methanoperedenaceae archaeon HGW-Methanoperedenaceae-1]
MSGKYISELVKSVPPSGIRKFFDLVLEMEDVISLGVGEPDFVTPWHIREACIYSLEKGSTSYTSNNGLLELRELLSKYISSEYDTVYAPDNELLVTTGVSEAADLAFRAIINPGDEVIIPEPCYVSYIPAVVFACGKPVPVPTYQEDDFRVTSEQIEESITAKTKAVVLSYPNNPTGAIMGRKDLEDIADVVNEHDLMVISDEVYDRLTYNGTHTCFASLPGMRDRTILLNGFSKSHAMTGLRVGYAAGSDEIIGAMTKIHQYTMLCAPITAQIGAIEALKNGDGEMKKMVREYDRRRRLVVGGLNKMGLDCFEPKGAFYAFPSIKSTGLTSDEFASRLLKEQKVAVVPGEVFGECGAGYLRCSYATSREELIEALARIETFIDSI